MIYEWMKQLLSVFPENIQVVFLSMLVLLVVLVGIALFLLMLQAILKIQWQKRRQEKPLLIQNRGNLPTSFRLQIFPLAPAVQFDFSASGVPLSPFEVAEPEEILPIQSSASSSAAAKQESKTIDGRVVQDQGKLKNAKDFANKGKDQAEKGLTKFKLFGTILGTLGGLLPGELGASIKKSSVQVQGQAQSAGAAMQRPGEKLKTFENLKGQVSQAAGKAEQFSGPMVEDTGVNDKPTQVDLSSAQQIKSIEKQKRTSRKAKPSTVRDVYYQTQEVPPREILKLTLSAKPPHRYRKASYDCVVNISPEFKDPPTKFAVPKASSLKTTFSFKQIPFYYFIFTVFLVLGSFSVNTTWVVLVIRWLSQFLGQS